MIVLHVSCLCSKKYRATPVKPWLQAIFYDSGGRFIGSNGLGNRLSMTEDEGAPKIRRHYPKTSLSANEQCINISTSCHKFARHLFLCSLFAGLWTRHLR